MPQPALKTQGEAERERARLEAELKQILQKLGLTREEKGPVLVDITEMRKWYLPENYYKSPAYMKEGGKEYVEYGYFFKAYYEGFRKDSKRRKPEIFVDMAYGKEHTFRETTVGIGGSGTVPFRLETMKVEEPTIEATVGVWRKEMGESTGSVEAGVSLGEKTEPFVRAEKAGFFAKLADGVKKLVAGITEGIFSLVANVAKKVEYFFSITLGPWIGKINLATGHLSGAFSWITAGYQMFMKIIGRLFEEKFEEKPLFTAYAGPKGAAVGQEIAGKAGEREIVVKVKERKGNVITDEKGNDYRVEEKEGYVTLYAKTGFLKKLGQSFNPVQLAKDAVDITIVAPVLRVGDTVDTFRAPEERKLADKEKAKYKERMEDALGRENYNTARRLAKALVANSKGGEKAAYMLELDRIEWKLAHSGLFVGYFAGAGFGNKKKMAEKEIEKRVRENIEVLKKARGGGRVDPDEYACARIYLAAKVPSKEAQYGLGKKVPESPLPARLAKEVWKEASMHPDEFYAFGAEGGAPTMALSMDVDFRKVAAPAGLDAQQAERWARIMELAQAVHDRTKYKDSTANFFAIISRENSDEIKRRFFQIYDRRLAGEYALPQDIAPLDSGRLEKYYEVMTGKQG